MPGRRFDLVLVTNYLHRPILPDIIGAVAPGGLLLYETFALGNERFGKPSNPDFLLRPGELAAAVAGHLEILAFEDLELGRRGRPSSSISPRGEVILELSRRSDLLLQGICRLLPPTQT